MTRFPRLHILYSVLNQQHTDSEKDGDIFSQLCVIQDILVLGFRCRVAQGVLNWGLFSGEGQEAGFYALQLSSRVHCTEVLICRNSGIGSRQGPHRAWERLPTGPLGWALPPGHEPLRLCEGGQQLGHLSYIYIFLSQE